MKKIEAIIRTSKLEPVKSALTKLGIDGMTVSEVRGSGRQRAHTEIYRGTEYSTDFLPRIKVEVVLADSLCPSAMEVIIKAAQTGKLGDGRIFSAPVEKVVRIRTGENCEMPL